MKKIFMFICLLFVASTASAQNTKLNATAVGYFNNSNLSYLNLDIHRSQQVLSRYLKENLQCSEVKLCLKVTKMPKSRLFKTIPGEFTAQLTATCNASFSDFKFDIGPAWDWEEFTDVLVGYRQNNTWIEKDIIARLHGQDYQQASSIISVNGCDSSPIDYNLPYKIISNPDLIRGFPN